MKLKKLVGSLVLMGVVSSSAFAATADTQAQLDSLKAQVAKMEAAMQQNQPGGFQINDGWANRITLSGQANIDAAYANKSPIFFNTNGYVSDLFLNNANLYVDAKASDWTTAHLGFAYGTTSSNFARMRPGAGGGFAHANSILDEAYVNIANFAKSPFFMKAGKQFVPFGDYVPYADITPSFTQLLSQTRAVSANVGFVDASGFNGSIYAFRGDNVRAGSVEATSGLSRIKNWGLNLGFANSMSDVGFKLGAGYIRNIADADFISQTVYTTGASASGLTSVSNLLFGTYVKAVGGLSLNAAARYAAFDGSVKYVRALSDFNVADVAYTNNMGTSYSGAKPQAWGADVGYSFPTMGHQSRFGLGYQGTNQAALVGHSDTNTTNINAQGLPKTRYLANYSVNVSKYTDLGFEVRSDRNYPASHRSTNYTGTAGTATVGTVRLSVKFA